MSGSLFSLVAARRRLPLPRWAIAIILLWLAGVAAFTWLTRGTEPAPTLCVFRNLTSVPCPTCGTTRAVLAAAEGRMLDALLCNPFVTAALTVGLAWLVLRLGFGRAVHFTAPRPWKRAMWIALIALFLVNWAYVIWRDQG